MNQTCCCIFLLWLQVRFAVHGHEIADVDFLSHKFRPGECIRFYKMLRHQATTEHRQESRLFDDASNCKKLLVSWLRDFEEASQMFSRRAEPTLKLMGRSDLARHLRYQQVRSQQSKELTDSQDNPRRNMAVDFDDGRKSVRAVPITKAPPTGERPRTTVFQKIMYTMTALLSMTALCLCCYKIIYARMRGGNFNSFRKECDEESWLQPDMTKDNGSCDIDYEKLSVHDESFWYPFDSKKFSPFSPIQFIKKKYENHKDKEECYQQLHSSTSKLHQEKKVIHLSRQEQYLLKSLSAAERQQFPESDLEFLAASDRKKNLLARESRKEFLLELRKRLEEIGSDRKSMELTESERCWVRKLYPSERLLLPITDKELRLLSSNSLQKRQIILEQLTSKLADILPEDRKYLELDSSEKSFLRDAEDKELHQLGTTESELQFLVASDSQRNMMHQRLTSSDRDDRMANILKKLKRVDHDVSRLKLSRLETSLLLSLTSSELARLGLTKEHVGYYAATDSERKALWPSPSQLRNLRIGTLKQKLSKLPWKRCDMELTASEEQLVASMSPREEGKLCVSESEKTVILSADRNREFMTRRKTNERLDSGSTKFAERNKAAMECPYSLEIQPVNSKSYRGTTETQMTTEQQNKCDGNQNNDSLDQVLLLSPKPDTCSPETRIDTLPATVKSRKAKIANVKDKIRSEGVYSVRLTESEKLLVASLSASEIKIVGVTSSQLAFLVGSVSKETIVHHNATCGEQMRIRSNGKVAKGNALSNTSSSYAQSEICKRDFNVAPISEKPDTSDEVHFKESASNEIDQSTTIRQSGDAECEQEELDPSELDESYDELGMLFSQQMKEQLRPCHRKYCLVRRRLGRDQHDVRRCHTRNPCCKIYPIDQRPSCGSSNVCDETYDEFHLMRATPCQQRQLSDSMFRRRKQFLDQPCKQCSGICQTNRFCGDQNRAMNLGDSYTRG